MIRNKNDNNKGSINTDTDPFKLPIEEQHYLATPTHDNDNLATPYSSTKDTGVVTPSPPSVKGLGPLVNPPSQVNFAIIGFEANIYIKCHEKNTNKGEYNVQFLAIMEKHVTRMDVKDTIRLYCLIDQSHEETEIRYTNLNQFKANKLKKFLNPTETLELDVIYVYYHELDEGHY